MLLGCTTVAKPSGSVSASRRLLLARRARNVSGTATQYARGNDSLLGVAAMPWSPPAAMTASVLPVCLVDHGRGLVDHGRGPVGGTTFPLRLGDGGGGVSGSSCRRLDGSCICAGSRRRDCLGVAPGGRRRKAPAPDPATTNPLPKCAFVSTLNCVARRSGWRDTGKSRSNWAAVKMIWERVPFAHREPPTTRRGTGSHGLLRILRAVAAASAGARAPPAGIRREPVGLRDGALHAAVVLRRQQDALRTHRRRASYYASMTCVYVQLERRGTPARRWYRGHGSASLRRIPTPPSPPCHQLDI
jgi:hypothetical protein